MTASTRRELRSAATSTSTTAIGLIRALTDARPIKPTSTRCLSARRPNPGRGSTYRRGNSVQTTAATSIVSIIVSIIKCILGLIPGVIHYGTPHPRLDASLLRCTLPSRALHAFQLRQQPLRFLLRRPASDHRLRYLLLCLAVELVNSPWSKPASEAICSGRPGQRLVRLRQ